MGCRMFHPPILAMDRSITTFGSIITKFFANFSSVTLFWNNSSFITMFWTKSSFITLFWTKSSFITIFWLLFPNLTLDFSWDLGHLLLDTYRTLLRRNVSFVHPSRRDGLQHKHGPRTMPSELLFSDRTVVLTLSSCSSPAASDPLFPTWMSLIPTSSCQFSLMLSPPDAFACRTTTCSSGLFPGSTGTSPAPRSTRALFLSLTRAVSAILSLYAFILVFPVEVLSMIVPILSRHSLLCGFLAFPYDASAAHPGQPPVCPWAFRRQDVESSGFMLWRSFNLNPWQWWLPLLCQIWLCSSTSVLEPPSATGCHANLPRSSIPKHNSVSVLSSFCLAQLHSW